MSCTSKPACHKDPALCLCASADQRTPRPTAPPPVPRAYRQSSTEPTDGLPLVPFTPRQAVAVVLLFVASALLMLALPRWLWATYQHHITHAASTANTALLAYAQAVVRALWHMANLLG